MQIQALGAGVVAIGGGFVAPNVLLGLESSLRQIAVGIEVFAADADVEQVLFDVFQQAGVASGSFRVWYTRAVSLPPK